MPEDLKSALADLSSGNVVTGLSFLVERALKSSPEQLYEDDALYQALATSKNSEIEAAKKLLSVNFGKDFSARRYTALIKEAREQLEAALPTSGFIVSQSGEPKSCLANAIIQLSTVLDVRYDEFSARAVHQKPSPWGTSGPWRDRDDSEAANYLQHNRVLVNGDIAHEAAHALALRNPYHQVRDWMTSLRWDGIPRLESFATDLLGCPDGPWERSVSKAWPISAVARIMRPGVQAKYMIVLEGDQDAGKSKALQAFTNGHLEGDTGRQWFRDNMPEIDSKDIGMFMQGVWVIEVGELAKFRGKEWERVKSFISSPREVFRVPYGRNMQDYPRQVVFAGTTNEYQWGGDQTGLVRFWPLRTGKINIDGILRSYEQLWAEARFLFDEGHSWHGVDPVLARQEQAARQPDDEYREGIVAAISKRGEFDDWITTSQILDFMQIPMEKRKSYKFPVGHAFRSMGYEKKQQRLNGEPTWGWVKKEG